MRVTFDTNTLEKAARPERCARDPLHSQYVRVHQAIVDGRIKGFVCETIVGLEGIEKVDRATVFGSTRFGPTERVFEDPTTGTTVIQMNLTVETPARQPLHPEMAARIQAAIGLGMKFLKAPRIGGEGLDVQQDKVILVQDADELALRARLDKYHEVSREIEARGVGIAQAKALGSKFAARAKMQAPWFRCLELAADVHERSAVVRSIAEWADGDSIAAHIGYGMDYFCTGDEGKGAGSASVFDAANRAWLTATYGTKFITMTQLAAMV